MAHRQYFFIYLREMMQIGEAVALGSQQRLNDLNFETNYFFIQSDVLGNLHSQLRCSDGVSTHIIQLAEFGTYSNTEGLAIASQAWASLIGQALDNLRHCPDGNRCAAPACSLNDSLEPLLAVACRASITIILCCAASAYTAISVHLGQLPLDRRVYDYRGQSQWRKAL